MKRRYKLKIKEINLLFDKLHGNAPSVPEKATVIEQPESVGTYPVLGNQESGEDIHSLPEGADVERQD